MTENNFFEARKSGYDAYDEALKRTNNKAGEVTMTEKKETPFVKQLKKELRQAEFIGKFKEREIERREK